MTSPIDYRKMNAAEYTAWKAKGGTRAVQGEVIEPQTRAVIVPDRSITPWKAVQGLNAYVNATPSTMLTSTTDQQKAATFLKAYTVGWFYKAGNKIANDVAALDWTVSEGDMEEGEDETTLDRPDLRLPFDSLSPIDQFQRLLERPNPRYTGRQLLRKTEVRLDFAGAAAWYLEGGDGGLPSAIYGISPSRMWPSHDRAGNLIGWVMDKNAPSGGVPFETSEILWFSTGNARDDDIWGTSVVEAVYSQVPLTDLMARHTATVLTTGGRLAGMIWPKERSLSEDEFLDAQRAWRNVVSDPMAGKRMLIFPEPMEYAAGASTPQEIGIPELATLNRDEILTAFPISPYRLGVPMPGGLNSGEVRAEDRRDYWEETIHPRADLIEETIQVGLLSRYEEVAGTTYDFEIPEPNMDVPATLIVKSQAFKDLVGIGLDPKEALKAVGLGHIKWTGLPAILDPAQQQMMRERQVEALEETPAAPPSTKAARAVEVRDRVVDPAVTVGKLELQRFFDEQRKRVSMNIAQSLPDTRDGRKAYVKADPLWWDGDLEDRELSKAIRSLYTEVGRGALQNAADQLGRVLVKQSVEPIVADLLRNGGARIKDINDRTLQSVTIELAEGTRRGYSIPQLIEGVSDEGYRGVLGVTLENGTPAFGDLRAETIARTETALSYNRASVRGYEELGIREFLAYDGDDDPECAARNGQTFPADEAAEIEDHPNGTLVWSPVVGGIEKSWHEQGPIVQNFIMGGEGIKALEPPPSPVITVEPAPVTVDLDPLLAAVNDLRNDVKAIDIQPVISAAPVTDVRIVDDVRPPRERRVVRGKDGRITGVVEGRDGR